VLRIGGGWDQPSQGQSKKTFGKGQQSRAFREKKIGERSGKNGQINAGRAWACLRVGKGRKTELEVGGEKDHLVKKVEGY